MAWKTKKQRKIEKVKSRVKKTVVILLIVLVVVGVGMLHGNESKKTTNTTMTTESSPYSFGSNNEDIEGHCFSVSLDGHILQIKW